MDAVGALPVSTVLLAVTSLLLMVSTWTLRRLVMQLDGIEHRVRALETRMAVAESTLRLYRAPYTLNEGRADA